MNKKNLLYIVPSLSFFSKGYRGRVMHALGICEGYIENGWSVTIIGGDLLSKFNLDMPSSVNIVEVKEPDGILKYPIWWFKIYKVFFNEVRRSVFHCIMIRYVASSAMLIYLISLFAPKQSKKVLEVNSFAYHMLSKLPIWLNQLVAGIEITIVNFFDILYVVSQTMAADHRNKRCKAIIVTVENGATSKRINFNDHSINKHITPRLIYLGTLMPYWDFEYLVAAINKLHYNIKVEFVVLGDGPKLHYLKKHLSNKDLVTFYGSFSRNDLGNIIRPTYDILLLPPKTKDDMLLTGGLSTKLFDYLSMRIPILAPSDGEINSVLVDRFNSVLYKSDDISDFQSSARVLLKNKNLREQIAINGFADYVKNYSWGARMSKIIKKTELFNR